MNVQNVTRAQQTLPFFLMEVFRERCWARAYLWAYGEIENLPDAVDPLQELADTSGLTKAFDVDVIQAVMADAFRPFRFEGAS